MRARTLWSILPVLFGCANADGQPRETPSVAGPVVIVAKAARRSRSIGADVWWDVGVAGASDLARTRKAAARFLEGRKHQRALV